MPMSGARFSAEPERIGAARKAEKRPGRITGRTLKSLGEDA